MLVDSLKLLEGSVNTNLSVPSGSSFPSLPSDGELFYNTDNTNLYVYSSGTWVSILPIQEVQYYRLGGFVNGTLSTSQIIIRVPVSDDITFPINFSGSFATSSVAAASSASFVISKIVSGTTTQIGTMSFAAGATIATFSTVGGTTKTLSAGEVVLITAPSSADSTLANVGFALVSTRN